MIRTWKEIKAKSPTKQQPPNMDEENLGKEALL
jgi:hypothetical protein